MVVVWRTEIAHDTQASTGSYIHRTLSLVVSLTLPYTGLCSRAVPSLIAKHRTRAETLPNPAPGSLAGIGVHGNCIAPGALE